VYISELRVVVRNVAKVANLDLETADHITAIIHNKLLAEAICCSIRAGLDNPCVHTMGSTAQEVFNYSLDAAIRDIESHPLGKLFQRFLDYGPPDPDAPKQLTSDGKTYLSDPECGTVVQFIFSHMVNRFKGELAELLSIAPCLELVEKLCQEQRLPKGFDLYFGDLIQERRQIKSGNERKWSGLTKGADGLVVKAIEMDTQPDQGKLNVLAVIEIKSMPISKEKLVRQINHHRERLAGGVKLNEDLWDGEQIVQASPLSIMIIPSTWRISREWSRNETESGWQLILPEPQEPPVSVQFEEIQPTQWQITLNWSKEALEQAAYEMTFWYMAEVGKVIYQNKPLPKEWTGMTPEEAGYNSIKMMLYYLILRYISKYQGHRAIKLYNAYSFGYPLAVDAKDMLWPEDFSTSSSF
jgi:hypothetical protein